MADHPEPLSAPSHVPPELIIDWDYHNPAGLAEEGDIYRALKRLHAYPDDILWTPRNGGHWIVTRADDVRWVREEAEIFSHEEFILPPGSMNTLMPPTNVDPPYHARFRAVLNPVFSLGRIRTLTENTRAMTAGLIDKLVPSGSCEFQRDFARVMPVHVFLGMLDLPTDRGDEFVSWATSYVHAKDQDEREWATEKVTGFLRGLLDEREANPGDDMFSRIVAFRKNPRFEREEEVMGMAMNSFIGGLDTVTNMLTFTAWHLATLPAARQRLIAEPKIVPRAAEEYLRRFGLAVTARIIKADVGRKGVAMKKGDYLLVVDPLAGIDERIWDDPMEIDFDRDTRVHDTFGNGVHRCVGEHLARMELVVFIEEWLKRIPDFSLDPEVPPVTCGGAVIGMPQLGLRWGV